MSATSGITPEVQSLMETVAVRTAGATPDLIRHQVGDAMREFFRKTCTWTEPVTLTTRPGVYEYTLTSPDHSQVCWVVNAYFGSRPLALRPLPYQDPLQRRVEPVQDAAAPPESIECPTPGLVHITPRPAAVFQVHLQVAYTPTDARSPVAPGLVSLYHDILMDGTLSRLFGTPNMPFYSSKLAEYHGRRFRTGMTEARESVRRGYVSGLQPVLPYPLPAGRITR